jgi:hypothetical protein
MTWLFFIMSLLEGIRIYLCVKSSGLSSYSSSFSTYLISTTLGTSISYAGNYSGNILTAYDSWIMSIIPGVNFLIIFIFYLIWKGHYFSEIAEMDEDNSVIKP